MVSEELKLLEGYLTDIREDIRAVRGDLHTFIARANEVDAAQGAMISALQVRVDDHSQELRDLWEAVETARKDRWALWQKVWTFGITGALVANIVLGDKWETVVSP